eukprot:scaffold102138_cov45-Tisochrysis_lutea.AAC.1
MLEVGLAVFAVADSVWSTRALTHWANGEVVLELWASHENLQLSRNKCAFSEQPGAESSRVSAKGLKSCMASKSGEPALNATTGLHSSGVV